MLASGNNACPMCRLFFDKAFKPEVDKVLQEEVKKFSSTKYDEKKAELIKEGEWFGEGSKIVKLRIGNQYESIKNPKMWDKTGNYPLEHRWAMFISLDNDNRLTRKFIKSVTYKLHPTYKISSIKVSEPPFLLSRTAYGWFNIECHIEF
jgi:predicted house-cleaning noncanonical NTP pyrophosphatase (MazG superfamily)